MKQSSKMLFNFFFSFIKLKKNLKQTLTNIKKFFLSQTIKCTLIFSSWFFNHQKDYLIKKFAVKNIYCSIHYLFIYSLLWNCIAPLLKLNKLLKIYFYLMHSPWKNRGLNYNKLTQKWWALTWSFYICDIFLFNLIKYVNKTPKKRLLTYLLPHFHT